MHKSAVGGRLSTQCTGDHDVYTASHAANTIHPSVSYCIHSPATADAASTNITCNQCPNSARPFLRLVSEMTYYVTTLLRVKHTICKTLLNSTQLMCARRLRHGYSNGYGKFSSGAIYHTDAPSSKTRPMGVVRITHCVYPTV